MKLNSPAARRSQSVATVGLGLVTGFAIGYIFMSSVDTIFQKKSASSQILGSTPAETAGNALGRVGLQETLLEPEQVIVKKAAQESKGSGDAEVTYHTMMTSNGSPYLNIQTRIMYQTYKMVQKMDGGEKMVAFTRILHRTVPDILMDEVPTFRAEPLNPKCDDWCEFPVTDRANAVKQFFQAADQDPSLIKAKWIFMLEGDYVWTRPLQPIPRADSEQPGWAFPYGYIQPEYPTLSQVMRQMYPEELGPLSNIPNTGPAPVLMRVPDWKKCIPDWERLAEQIETTAELRERLGWVREMYGFSIATALQKIKLELLLPPNSPLMAQPPQDIVQGNGALFHYTWGTLINDKDRNQVWIFDKRDYTASSHALKVPKFNLPPPWEPGLRLNDGHEWSVELHNITTAMLTQMNRASDLLPDLTDKQSKQSSAQ